jgi:hypothetical protein
MQPKISRQVGIAVLLICRCSTIGLGETFEERQDDREPPPPPSHSQTNRLAELRMKSATSPPTHYGWTAFKPR